jgi:hypothetical protein
MAKKKDPRLERARVDGYNKPKRTPSHPTKSHIVVAKDGENVKTIRFGEQGAKTAGKPKAGESQAMKDKRASFKARHAKNIAKGKMSAAYWANRSNPINTAIDLPSASVQPIGPGSIFSDCSVPIYFAYHGHTAGST